MDLVTTFPSLSEFAEAVACLDGLRLQYRVIRPEPGYASVGTPAIVMDDAVRMELAAAGKTFVSSGWVDYHPPRIRVPDDAPPEFEEDIFGQVAVVVLAPCVADPEKIRIVAHVAGDLGPVLPYLNAEIRSGSYNADGPIFTFMDGYRLISLYPHRIAAAKCDEIVDAWRTLERIRVLAGEIWARRAEIEPSYASRERPPALEIFKRLPGMNCGLCGERTCLAFAVKLRQGEASPFLCTPIFGGERGSLRDALMEICAGLGVAGPASDRGGPAMTANGSENEGGSHA